MNLIQKTIAHLDTFQRTHAWIAFPFAVIKKYSDDNASQYGALITYYGFLALFPLLLAATAGLELVFRHNVHLQTNILTHIDNYFPLIGNQLHRNITSVGRTGLALLVSVGVAVYGAHGATDAVRRALDAFWGVPKAKQAGFPKNTLRSLAMIAVGGSTLVATAVLSSYATSLGHAALFKIVFTLVSLILLIVGLFFMQRLGLSVSEGLRRPLLLSATLGAVGFQILQTYGGYLMTHELQRLNTPYGAFSITLALLFWIYLQVEVMLYVIEIGVVHAKHLWPRSIQ